MANLSRLRRERMFDFLNNLKVENRHDEKILQSIAEIENELNEKKYGLVWEVHSEEVDEMIADNVPILIEDKSREIATAGDDKYNFLIEGDNLHSLKLLDKTHHEKIDVIYIDPPYNTGNGDFRYDDKFVDSNDTFRHSKWISFMSERLNLAKDLLRDSGCIFISIDANEFAQLKMLGDSIFDESNFIGSLIWRKKSGGGQTDEFFVTEHEYILCWRKTSAFKWINQRLDADENDYRFEDENGRYNIIKLEKWGSSAHREDRPTMYSAIKTPDGDDYYPIAPDGRPGRWRVGTDKLNKLIASNKVYWQKKGEKWTPYEKVYFSNDKGKLIKSRSILYDIAETGTATKQLTEIFGAKDLFETVKPIEMLQFLIKHVKSDIILDFFAGSGSTAHAVLALNQQDGENRKFILCTNNESNICSDVTYPRIKTVITGTRPDGSKYSDGIQANCKYYKTEFVAKNSETLVDDLIAHTNEMIQLEYGVQIDKDKYISILTDEEADELFENWNKYPNIKAIYVSRHVILNAEQRKLFYTKDVYIIPDYYYREELREVGE